ncbi:MAG: hypothetical protein ACI4AE_05240 [Candidatus Cryptobacteroides sp.]
MKAYYFLSLFLAVLCIACNKNNNDDSIDDGPYDSYSIAGSIATLGNDCEFEYYIDDKEQDIEGFNYRDIHISKISDCSVKISFGMTGATQYIDFIIPEVQLKGEIGYALVEKQDVGLTFAVDGNEKYKCDAVLYGEVSNGFFGQAETKNSLAMRNDLEGFLTLEWEYDGRKHILKMTAIYDSIELRDF